MCGIFCGSFVKSCCPKDNTSSVACQKIISGLQKLEYRGYDSFGLAYLHRENIEVFKNVGSIEKHKDCLNNLDFSLAISHTRWASHGNVCKENSHPFLSYNKNFAIVCNGIIENYQNLKNSLQNVEFSSQTDSEIVAHLLEKFYVDDTKKTLQKVCSMLVGNFAICVLCKRTSAIYCAKNSSPLMLSSTPDGNFVASDILAIDRIKSFYALREKEIAVINQSGIFIYDDQLNIKNPLFNCVETNGLETQKHQYSCFMEKEIFEIPQTLYSTLIHNKNTTFAQNFDMLMFIGCGTAYHAGLYAKKLFENNQKVFCSCEIASEFLGSVPYMSKNCLCVFISQSGETQDTLSAVKICKNLGKKTLCITNNKYSRIVSMCDYVFLTHCQNEISVAATKTYNSQLGLIAQLSKKNFRPATLKFLCEKVLTLADEIKSFAKKYAHFSKFFFLGKNYDLISAREGALKLKEVSYKSCEAFACGELKHGTLSLVDSDTLAIFCVTQRENAKKVLNSQNEVISRGAKSLLITTLAENFEGDVLKLPQVDYELAPIITSIVFDIFAKDLALQLNLNPDRPRNLAKSVTVE